MRLDYIRKIEREEVGLCEPDAHVEALRSPIHSVLQEYISDLTARGRSTDHIEKQEIFVKRIAADCQWKVSGPSSTMGQVRISHRSCPALCGRRY